MKTLTVAQAKARLNELVGRVEAGEIIGITRRGKPVARLSPATAPRQPVDLAALQALTESMPAQMREAADLIRSIRDADRS